MALKMIKDNENEALQRFYDLRIFGGTVLEGKEEEEEGTKKKKKESVRFVRTGVVTISPAISVSPVKVIESTISKKATLRDNLLENSNSALAPFANKFVEHGVYVARLGINPNYAKISKTSDEDVEILKKCIKYIYQISNSCARPAGTINFNHIWWAEHSNALGSFNENKFFDALTPVKILNPEQSSKSNAEYKFPTPEECGFNFKVEDLAM